MSTPTRPNDHALLMAYEAALNVASDLELNPLLQRIADLARDVVPSKYAALGIAEEGRIIKFITSGISPEERARIGPLPEGHGLLGALIRTGRSLMVPDIAADPRSFGFPPGHPPMRSLLGTPILLRQRVLGDLYLTEKLGGDAYTDQDLAILQVLAAHVASAIERARLYSELEQAHELAVQQRDQLRATVSQLREAEQLKDDFLSLVSHEFRTPLTAIQGGAHLLVNEADRLDDETRTELLADIVMESDRLDRMLANMLSLAAIMAGRLKPSTEPVLLGPFVRRMVREAESRAPDYHFEVSVPSALPPAEGDPDLLSQVLRNLYENAVKYTPAGGNIVTQAKLLHNKLVLSISDSGSGIAAEHVTAVFDRFRRPGADPSVRGMGLGLYLSRLLIAVQDGRIWAESAGLGRGATFNVELPIAHDWENDERPQCPNG